MLRKQDYFTYVVESAREGRIEYLQNYYEEKGLTIIGLNDSQGVNTTTLFRKGLLEYIVSLLNCENLNPKVINAFSLMFNKTEHINYFLESNLSVEDIKNLQVAGMVSSLEKAMTDFKLPKFLGKVGYVSSALYRKKEGDDEVLLTDTIKEANEPIIIYSCGANDLMREGWNNPFSIGKDYKNCNKNDKYKYALEKFSDPKVTKRVINRVEGNINNILSLNDKADIYTLGIYIPKSMNHDGMDIFNDAIERYNEELQKLCEQYDQCYIDTEKVSQRYNTSKLNFHVSTRGHNELAEVILENMHDKKFWHRPKDRCTVRSNLKVYNHGLGDILVDLKKDLKFLEESSKGATGREAEVYKEKIAEVNRQKEVVEKVIVKKK